VHGGDLEGVHTAGWKSVAKGWLTGKPGYKDETAAKRIAAQAGEDLKLLNETFFLSKEGQNYRDTMLKKLREMKEDALKYSQKKEEKQKLPKKSWLQKIFGRSMFETSLHFYENGELCLGDEFENSIPVDTETLLRLWKNDLEIMEKNVRKWHTEVMQVATKAMIADLRWYISTTEREASQMNTVKGTLSRKSSAVGQGNVGSNHGSNLQSKSSTSSRNSSVESSGGHGSSYASQGNTNPNQEDHVQHWRVDDAGADDSGSDEDGSSSYYSRHSSIHSQGDGGMYTVHEGDHESRWDSMQSVNSHRGSAHSSMKGAHDSFRVENYISHTHRADENHAPVNSPPQQRVDSVQSSGSGRKLQRANTRAAFTNRGYRY
jgi:hypothetical protein